MSGEPGHLFVVDGDLTALAVDAALIPTDDQLRLEPPWRSMLDRSDVEIGDDWPEQPIPVPSSAAEAAGSPLWLISLGHLAAGEGDTVPPDEAALDQAIDRLLARVTRFVEGYLGRLGDAGSFRGGRSRPLLALPLLGTGGGGLFAHRSTLIRRLVAHLRALLERHPVDVVLVVHRDEEHLALCRRERRSCGLLPTVAQLAERWRTSDVLSGDDAGTPEEHLQRLAEATAAPQLVPFFGAGVSRASGAPVWDDLLREAADRLVDEPTRRTLAGVADHFDRAQALAAACEGGVAALDRHLRRLLSVSAPSLGHVLLANLRARDAITTNYDDGYERAVRATGRQVAVVPRRAPHRLLKLHGDVADDRAPLVLTRDQLLAAQIHQRALGGALQMLLLTSDLLFVGYSLRDPDLHAALHEVREVVSVAGGEDGVLATSLQVEPSDALALLWVGTVAVLWPDPTRYPDVAEASRQVEILLDVLADAAGASAVPLLATGVDERDLDGPERALRHALEQLADAHRRTAPTDDGGAWRPVTELLRRYGHDPA